MADYLTRPVLFLHKVGICSFSYYVLYNLYYIISFILFIFGLGGLNFFASVPILSGILYCIFSIGYFINSNVLIIILNILFWIFIFWMLIIMFVPFIIVFPIPIFPFFFIIPLKFLMLLLIPPFKTLTDLGTLQLVYRFFARMFSSDFYSNFFNQFLFPSAFDIGDYLYFNTSDIIQEYFNYNSFGNNNDNLFFSNEPPNNQNTVSPDGRTQDMINDGIDTNDNPDDIDKYNEFADTDKYSAAMDKINEDTQLCINMAQKFKLYNSSYIDDVNTDINNATSPYNDCYVKAIKSYLKSVNT